MFSCRAVCLCDMAWPTKGGLDLSSFQCKWHLQTSSFPSEQLVGSNLNEQIVSAHSCTEISGNAPFRWKSTEKGPGRQRNFLLMKGKSIAPSKLSIIQRRVTYKEGFRHWHFKDQQFVGFKGSMQFISGAKQRLRVFLGPFLPTDLAFSVAFLPRIQFVLSFWLWMCVMSQEPKPKIINCTRWIFPPAQHCQVSLALLITAQSWTPLPWVLLTHHPM